MTILITGVNQGLGKYLVQEFKKHDTSKNIIGVDRIEPVQLDPEVKNLLKDYYVSNLSNINKSVKVFKDIIAQNNEIKVVINNAGLKTFDKFLDISQTNIIDTYAVNTIMPLLINHLFLEKHEAVQIINISSNAGFYGYKTGSVYCSSKAALIQFTEAMINELKPKQFIYTLCPSTIATKEFLDEFPDINKEKYIQPEEVFRKITVLINGNKKSGVIPMISFKQRIKYLVYTIVKFIK